MASWYEGAWPAIAALIAGAFGWYRTSQLRESRRAAEILQLDQAISSAKAREDPIYHSYRAHALARMQEHYVDPSAAGGLVLPQTALATLFALALFTSTNMSLWWIGGMAVGAIGIGRLALRNFVQWRYGKRLLDAQTSEAHEQELAAARQAFIESPRKDPRQPWPSVRKNAADWWTRQTQRQRKDYRTLVIAICSIAVVALLVRYAILREWLGAWTILKLSSWTVAISSGLLVGMIFAFGRWVKLVVSSMRLRLALGSGAMALVVTASILWARPWIQNWFLQMIRDSSPPMSDGEVALALGAFLGTSVFVTFVVANAAWVLWRARSRPQGAQA